LLRFFRSTQPWFARNGVGMSFPNESLRQIWAPWRVEYFAQKERGDFFREAAESSDDAAHLVVCRRKNSFLMLNRYPYAVGHMMAVPYRQAADLADLGDDERLELWELAAHAQRLLRDAVTAQGFNIGLNLGACAGAGVIDRLHLHIVPRWAGDNNFMPVLSDTRVMPEALAAVYIRLLETQKAAV
jgi:ATP adenylyltransferase